MRAYIAIALLASVGAACNSAAGLCGDAEVSRTPSPGLAVEAVIIERSCGATTGFNYAVHLVPFGQPATRANQVAWLHDAIRNQSAYGVNAKWRGPGDLVLEYFQARDTGRVQGTTGLPGQDVRVRFDAGVYDSTAPGGGMHYNLEHQPR